MVSNNAKDMQLLYIKPQFCPLKAHFLMSNFNRYSYIHMCIKDLRRSILSATSDEVMEDKWCAKKHSKVQLRLQWSELVSPKAAVLYALNYKHSTVSFAVWLSISVVPPLSHSAV